VHEIAKEENAQPGFQISQALIMALYYTVCFIPELILLSLNELNAPKLGLQPFPPYIMLLVFDGLMLMFTIALFCRGNRVKQTQVEPQETETPVDVERQNLLPSTDIAQNANLSNVQLGEDAGNQARPNTAQGLIEMRPIEMRPIDRKQVMDEADDLDEPLWMNPAPVKGATVSRVQQAFRLGEIRPSRVPRTEPKEASSDYSALNDNIGFDHIGSSRATGSNQSENKKYECGICLSTDKRPFAFNCFHVVCESCAETLSISPGKCPYCQQQILAKHPIFL
jgi:hypothetical protein